MSDQLHGDAWLESLRTRIFQITPQQALERQAQGAALLDVREEAERVAGSPAGALGLSRSFLELRIEQVQPDRQRATLLLCGSGQRSLLAAETLQRMGYARAASITGGFSRWKAEGLPVSGPALDGDMLQRYSRQLSLGEVGATGQAKLSEARVALVGAGGLGCPAALYLAAAGVGRLTLIDDDRVERSNLHRQVLHADARVGMHKVESARIALQALNPRIAIATHAERLQAANVERLLAGHDVVIDAADNFPARYLLAAASVRLKIPMVYAAVERFSGQLSVFDPRRNDSPCYRCLFPRPPAAADAPNCSEAGVLGVLPGVLGLMQATETLKLLLGIGEPLVGRLLNFDALDMRFRELQLPRDPACPGCGEHAVFSGYQDVVAICGSQC